MRQRATRGFRVNATDSITQRRIFFMRILRNPLYNPYNPQYYSSFHFLFHYPNINQILVIPYITPYSSFHFLFHYPYIPNIIPYITPMDSIPKEAMRADLEQPGCRFLAF